MPENHLPLAKEHNPALDGVRGIAIILVILYHNYNFIEYFNYGWLGVDLFFVLSGYLITKILLQTNQSSNYFKNFYARRILRIFPVYYLSLFLFLVLLPAIKSFPLDVQYYQQNQFWFWTYLQNWTLVLNQEGQGTVLNHFWSLAVEEQYYLIWPFMVFFIRNPKKLLACCIVLLLVVIAARLYIWYQREFFPAYERLFLFTRIDGILIGSMLAIIQLINPFFVRKYFTAFIISLVVFNYLFYFLNRRYHFIFPPWPIAGFTTFSAIFALGIYEAVMKENKFIFRFLSLPVFRFLGKYSYGFYIFHFPVFWMVNDLAEKFSLNFFDNPSFPFSLLSSTIGTLAGLVVSIFIYHAFEKHFLKLKRYFE
jgi:peptidoglycan/LPS O-acetylase OafA/YrhL